MSISSVANELLNDLLFPTRCLGCDQRAGFTPSGAEGWFCDQCHAASELMRSVTHCQRCNRVVGEAGQLCRFDRGTSELGGFASYGDYHAPPLRRALHKLKIGGVSAALPALSARAWDRLGPVVRTHDWHAIVPIPSNPDRDRRRGFNPAAELARVLASWIRRDIRRDLIRTKSVTPQIELTRIERLKNLDGVFGWQGARLGGRVLLVDDVTTTGATLEEAAQTLRSAGAREVWAVTLAHEV